MVPGEASADDTTNGAFWGRAQPLVAPETRGLPLRTPGSPAIGHWRDETGVSVVASSSTGQPETSGNPAAELTRPTNPVRIMFVDDHEVFRLGLEALFETVPEFLVVGQAGSGKDALVVAKGCSPDVVLMDLQLPDQSGVEACRKICDELNGIRVIMLTCVEEDEAILTAISAGAVGYLSKEVPADRLIEAISRVADGESLLAPSVTARLLGLLRRGESTPLDPLRELSGQEHNILPLIAEGKTNRQIADILCLSEYTVKTYVSNILQKLQLNRRAEAAAFIVRHQAASSGSSERRLR